LNLIYYDIAPGDPDLDPPVYLLANAIRRLNDGFLLAGRSIIDLSLRQTGCDQRISYRIDAALREFHVLGGCPGPVGMAFEQNGAGVDALEVQHNLIDGGLSHRADL